MTSVKQKYLVKAMDSYITFQKIYYTSEFK